MRIIDMSYFFTESVIFVLFVMTHVKGTASVDFGAEALNALVPLDATAALASEMACQISSNNGVSEDKRNGLQCWHRTSHGWQSVTLEMKDADTRFVQVSCAGKQCCALADNGLARCWDTLGDERMRLGDHALVQISLGHEQVCGVKASDSRVRCWMLARPTVPEDRTVENDRTRFGQVSCGKEECCAIEASARGRLHCWAAHGSPLRSPPSDSVFSQVFLAKGGKFGVAIERGTRFLRAWGEDSYGQVSSAPRNLAVRDVSCGSHFCCAIPMDQTKQGLRCWGRQTSLQVGASLVKLQEFPHRFLAASEQEVCIGDASGMIQGCLPWRYSFPGSPSLSQAETSGIEQTRQDSL